MALKRIRGETLLPASFSLGKAGLFLNVFSVLFLTFTFGMSFFLPVPQPAVDIMNWNILVYGVVVVFNFGYYLLRGRYRYVGPVAYVRKSA
ncbi:hypothetical protein B0H67DRAFT_261339 [Lasiosphaeris hirsuta]|uniref:Uncharacterized protein n=1 Tax=Lasiosphaeris hirsuta TaxID=260670 RepID=A0AA40AI98_9PEZI|nr:hypothetical protein B0H67DRAFT_261339 [Lasiosphaeris hirsuta]